MRKSAVTFIVAAAAVTSMSACAPTKGVESLSSAPPAVVATTPAAEVKPTPTPTPTSSVQIGKWGEVYTFKDGLTVTLSQPVAYQPDNYAAGIEGYTAFVSFDVTITNGTTAVYRPAMFQLQGTSGGKAIIEVFDPANKIAPAMGAADILPGQSFTFKAAFGVENPADLTFDVQPGFDYTSVSFQGASA